MPQRSAGILLFRRGARGVEVLLVHPGGPFWAKKDDGAWSIPKGLHEPGEDPIAVARREFEEETGMCPEGEFVALGTFAQSRAKTIDVWAVEGDFDPAALKSNTFSMEWPPRSGRMATFPEVDRAQWLTPEEAGLKILKGQRPVLKALLERLVDESKAMPSSVYQQFREAILQKKQVTCLYQGKYREVCPHIIGRTDGKERVFVFQFAGQSDGPLPNWRCFDLSDVRDVHLQDGDWHEGKSHKRTQVCVDEIDLDINVHVRKRRKLL